MARIWVVVLLGTAVLWPPALLAQSPVDGTSPRVGDKFTYNTKDEITGEPREAYVAVVTEVSDKEMSPASALLAGMHPKSWCSIAT
jgi:hypothetical protein